MTWPDDPDDPERERRLVAEVDYFGEALKDPDEPDIYDSRYPLHKRTEQFCKFVDLASWYNKDWAVGMWHVLLGMLLRGQRIRDGDTHQDGRINLLIMAPSSSGKSRGADQLMKLIDMLTIEPPLDTRTLISATDASLVGSARERRVKGEVIREEVPGILDSADLLRWDEGTAIFADTGFNVNLLRIFNQAMNPIGTPGNVVSKELAGVTNTVHPRCSLVITMVDDPRVQEHVFRCGFYQRMLVMRRVTTNEDIVRAELRKKDLMDNPDQMRPVRADVGDLTLFLERIWQTFGNQPRPWDYRRVTGFIHKKFTEMLDAATAHPELAPYLREFPSRFADRMRILSMHNAVLRLMDNGTAGPFVIEPEDAKAAWWLVAKCARQFFAWSAEVAYQFEHLHRRNIRAKAQRDLGKTP